MEVKLGKFTGTLRKPASFMTAREVTMAVGQNALRGLGAQDQGPRRRLGAV